MWRPTALQEHRAGTIGRWFFDHLPPAFGFEIAAQRGPWIPRDFADSGSLTDERIDELRRLLEQSFPPASLPDGLVDFLCFPLASGLIPHENARHTSEGWWLSNLHWVAVRVATALVRPHHSPYAIGVVSQRLEYMLTHVGPGAESATGWLLPKTAYHALAADGCIDLLLAWSDDASARDHLRQLVTGRWRVPITLPGESISDRPENSYQYHAWAFGHVNRYWPALERDGHLDYPTFCVVAEVLDGRTRWLPHLVQTPFDATSLPLEQTLRQFEIRYLRQLAPDLGHCTLALWFGRRTEWHGLEWLLTACGLVERDGVTALPSDTYGDPSYMIRSLASIKGLDPGEGETAGAALRAFSARTLKALLPHTWHVAPLMLSALGWQDLEILDRLVRRMAQARFHSEGDAPNCADPASGAVDLAEIQDAVGRAGRPLVREYLKVMRASKLEVGRTLTLIEAVMGDNAAAIERGLVKQQQIAMKAFGLLPLTGGEAEAAARYTRLKDVERESRRYGPERKLNIKAAVEAALTNLAQVAGFPDRVRMEWALEARNADGALLEVQRLGDYDVVLELDDAPRVVARRNGRALKAMPAALKKDDRYLELADYAAGFKARRQRLRACLEQLMIAGESLAVRDLRSIAATPGSAAVLQGLFVRDAAGTFGIYDARAEAGLDLGGSGWQPVMPLQIVHPYHLAAAGRLDAAQRFVVSRRIVQPFKQVYRELYLLDASEQDLTATSRFAGYVVETRRASRLFEARDWLVRSVGVASPEKRFSGVPWTAQFSFPDAGHYLAETETATAGDLRFSGGRPYVSVPLGTVPPVVFSEAIRDADLVVSAAAWDGSRAWSRESAAWRGVLASEICREFGVHNVSIEGTFAHVQGTKGRYRIHLGSGVVHRDPGAQVCVVPAGATSDVASFLPFPADDDVTTASVIGLILLFANDGRITDPALLAQIC